MRVTENGNEIVTRAVGESMTGLDATADMHFRNGAVAISYVATLLLAEDGTVSLDDRLSRRLPDVPNPDRGTLGQLAPMTSGYHDYVLANDAFADAAYAAPFRASTTDDLLDFAVHKPLQYEPGTMQYEPGTDWSYAHTNYVLLALALEKATGRPVADRSASEFSSCRD